MITRWFSENHSKAAAAAAITVEVTKFTAMDARNQSLLHHHHHQEQGEGGGAFYACPNSDCWFLLHKRCAELPPKIKHPSHPEHALTLPLPPLWGNTCDVCHSTIDGLHYRCSDCDFDVHVRCASMALHIQDRVDENLLGNLEGKELLIIKHPSHDHPLGLKESLQGSGGYGGGGVQVYCDGCKEPISSSSSSSSSSTSGAGGGGGAFYACPNSDCWFLLHKRCAELPTKIEHPSRPEHALNLSPFLLYGRECDVCHSEIDGFLYRCSSCPSGVHVRCASMAVRIQDRVDENNEIHQHALIPLEKKAQFLCDACGREHIGKSYLCPTCGFWANQICASAPTTISLRSHPHPLTLFRSSRYSIRNCKICNKRMNIEYWGYRCSEECKYLVWVACRWRRLRIRTRISKQTFVQNQRAIKLRYPRILRKRLFPSLGQC